MNSKQIMARAIDPCAFNHHAGPIRQEKAISKAQRILSALKEAGFVVVPVTPTVNMKRAGARSIGKTMGKENHTLRSDACWRAMIAAQEEDDG